MARLRAWRSVCLSIAGSVALLPVLLQPLPAAASPTGTLFAITGSQSLVQVNPGAGTFSTVGNLNTPDSPQSVALASDPATHRLFAMRTSGPTFTQNLLTIDSRTGTILASPQFTSLATQSLVFDTSSNTLFGFTGLAIVSVDPATAVTTTVATVATSFGPFVYSLALDSQSHTIYLSQEDVSGFTRTTRILSVSTQGGSLSTGPLLARPVRQIAVDSGHLFGITDCCPTDLVTIVTIDNSGATPFLANIAASIIQSGIATDTGTHTAFIDIENQVPPGSFVYKDRILSLNDQTGALVSLSIQDLPDSVAPLGMAFEPGTAPTDTSPPVTSVALSPAPNAAGLNNTNVTVTISATDPDGIADVATIHYSATGAQPIAPTVVAGSSASFTVTADGVTMVTYFAVDQAGNSEAPHTLELRIDKMPPVTSIALTPAPNGAGWNNTNVTVNLSATDPDGVADVAAVHYSAAGAQPVAATVVAGSSASLVVTAEGVTTVTYFASDKAGNTEAPHTHVIRIDKTLPAVTYAGNAGTYTVDQTVSITCTALDPANANGTPGSGLASSTCANVNAPAYTFPLGLNSLSASATDIAGNVGNGSTTFTVQVTYSSLCSLTARFIESSPAFQTLPALGEAQEDRLCALLATAGSAPEPAEKALVESYQKGLTLLVDMGFLTPAQAAILLTLSQAL